MRRGRRGTARTLALAAIGWAVVASLAGGCGRKEVARPAFTDPNPIPAGANRRDVEGRHGGRFVFVTIGDPKTFNPPLANEVSSTDLINGPLFVGLMAYDNLEQKTMPGLAESYTADSSGLRYTFKLRPGLRWSDGETLDADDVVFSARVSLDPNLPGATRDIFQSGGKAWEFEKLDSLTVAVNLAAPFGTLVDVIGSMYIIPEHKLKESYDNGTYASMWGVDTPPAEIVTNGPFVLKEYRPGEAAVLSRNPHYWEVDKKGQRLPYLDEYVFLIVKDLNTMALKFQAGETDLIDPIVLDQVPLFEDEAEKGGYQVVDLGQDLATDFMWLNQNPGRDPQGRPYVEPYKLRLFRDVRFRRAVSHSINREGIVKSVLQGRGVPLYEPYTRANKLFFNPNVPKFPFDPEKARALLDEMDLKDRNGDGVRETPEGRPVEFTLHTNAENNLRRSFGTIIAEDLGKVGVRVNFVPLEFNTLIERLRADYRYDAILLGLAASTPPDPALSGNVYRSNGITHNWNPRQKTPSTPAEASIDSLMDLMTVEREPAQRKVYFDQVQNIMGDQQFSNYIVNRKLYVGIRNHVRNAKPSIIRQHVTWNIQELWVDGGGARLAAR
jgi:peptide/nickel transport system substrate-binding protein